MLKTLVIGAQNIDLFAHAQGQVSMRDSNRAKLMLAYGGVACNIASNLALLGNKVSFLTVFGDDAFGDLAKQNLTKLHVAIGECVTVTQASNSMYMAVMDQDNDLLLGLNDMDILDALNVDFLKSKEAFISGFDILVLDTNLPTDALAYLLNNHADKQLIIDAVSAEKVIKIKGLLINVALLKVNALELAALSDKAMPEEQIDDLLLQGLQSVLVTDKGHEIMYKSRTECIKSMPILVDTIVNASGAGDAFLAGFTHGLMHDKSSSVSLELAKKMAYLTLQSPSSTNTNISLSSIE